MGSGLDLSVFFAGLARNPAYRYLVDAQVVMISHQTVSLADPVAALDGPGK